MKKILFDLSGAGQGYTGIGHDSRLIFSMLSANKDISLSGLIYPNERAAMPRLREAATDLPARIAAIIQGTSPRPRLPPRAAIAILEAFWKEYRAAARAGHAIARVPDWMKSDAIWRVLFDKSLLPQQRSDILAHDFFVSDVSVAQMADRSIYFPKWRYKQIDAQGFDAMVFPLPRPLRLPQGVRRIVRYHDAIPMTHPDTVGGQWSSLKREFNYTRFAAADGIFVCNSPMSVDDLDNLVPGAGERAVAIPCAIGDFDRSDIAAEDVPRIIERRHSLISLSPPGAASSDSAQDSHLMVDWAGLEAKPLRYIISVSALEPRKNFINAIRAWEMLRARTKQDVKFVIVGSGGWLNTPILTAMRPHVRAHNLFHLENVTAVELRQLYAGAELCVFPSFAEGFGFAPLEALRMGTPSVVSNLPVFRWTLTDAASFADPYDISEICQRVEELLDTPDNAGRRRSLLEKAPGILQRFSIERVSELWREFFAVTIDKLPMRDR
ncbi:MAG: glycosyltransferase family 4 protein [Pseudorhodoplanes sp.]|uniref:glycosyltransferase family 4 protein n=1 Tax=Pseudorhodoplanes sp. TaxID=1934341 RepID=UPI003D0AD292